MSKKNNISKQAVELYQMLNDWSMLNQQYDNMTGDFEKDIVEFNRQYLEAQKAAKEDYKNEE
ncbi:MAG: hypothetical protein CMH22_06140 [Methylophaga sp.]|nr:hypothetical protein [Methylophaga sp.]|tara:strand:+ start:48030 stop:48215 length:186 start_codon:yes stop_codon:yes gene_type:complete